MVDPAQVIYGQRDMTVREAVQFLAGLSNVELLAVEIYLRPAGR